MLIQLLVQVIYILFPILLYFPLLKNNSSLKKYKPIMIGLLCSFTIYLCMTHPISFVTGDLLDLRTIPWIISFQYGGFHVGIIVTGLMFIFSVILGGVGMYGVFIAYSISAVLLFTHFKNFSQLQNKKRLISTLTLTYVTASLVVLSTQLLFNFPIQDVIFFYFFFILVHLASMWFTVYIIETFNEYERLQFELKRSEKLNIVGQMAASVAHEIRNPMTTVQGFLQLLSQDSLTPNKHKEHFQIMKQELNRAETIISDYLTLAKPEAGKLDKLDLKKQIESINQSFSSFAIMNGVRLKFNILEDDHYYIKASSEKIQQVLVNIIKNAIEVSPKETVVQVSICKRNATIQITITDTGCGMSKEEIKSLGTPFYSLKKNGTGLGLTVCYCIVNSLGGRIEVESEKNHGTTFIISLPEYRQ
ncbi:ATP-binding protein [Halalkalibacter lacteus]|uniref:ATP-binding protein n=1 Tax=Halalkalibacter lacteus TaxID=3090663 RepID=UPI002FCA2796